MNTDVDTMLKWFERVKESVKSIRLFSQKTLDEIERERAKIKPMTTTISITEPRTA